MEPIIPPIDPRLVEAELTKDKFVRDTNNGKKKIYIITWEDSPNTMQELGRLREISFRDAGGGTGKAVDIDRFDTDPVNPFKQLIVWSPQDRQIVGGYRFLEGYNIPHNEEGILQSPTTQLFHLSPAFVEEYLPYSIELGRSFVQPDFQPIYNVRKGIYSLDNLWDGLGALTIDYPEIKYFFGKMTMYPRFNITARDMILYFLDKYFHDGEGLVTPYDPVNLVTDLSELERTFTGSDFDEDYKILIRNVRRFNETIPPLFNAYMNLSPTMLLFGTAINASFGHVEETAILITIEDIYDIKKDRHVSSYKRKDKKP
jgi:hypothetical protein